LLPLVPFIALGVVTVLNSGTSYRSTGVVKIIRQSTSATPNPEDPFGGQTAAVAASTDLNETLASEGFLDEVITEAGVGTMIEQGVLTRKEVRDSVYAAPVGDDWMTINAVTPNPELSLTLAKGTWGAYTRWLGGIITKQNETTANQLRAELARFDADRQVAKRELVDLQQRIGTVVLNDLTQYEPADATQLQAANAKVLRAEAAYDEKEKELNNTIAAERDRIAAEVDARYRLIDEPQAPTAPEPHRQKDALTLIMFTALGGLVCLAALVAGTLLDRSVRYTEEVESHLRVPVLGSVPDSRAAATPLGL
jgi:hypothetical protein